MGCQESTCNCSDASLILPLILTCEGEQAFDRCRNAHVCGQADGASPTSRTQPHLADTGRRSCCSMLHNCRAWFTSRDSSPFGRVDLRREYRSGFLLMLPVRLSPHSYSTCLIRDSAMSTAPYYNGTPMPNTYSFCVVSGNPPVWGWALCDWRFTIAQCDPVSPVSSLES